MLNKLSNRSKIIIGVVVAVIVTAVVWFFFFRSVSPQKALFLSTLELLVNPSIEGFEIVPESQINALGGDENIIKIMNAANQASKDLLSPVENTSLCFGNPDNFAKKFANIISHIGIAAKKLDNISSLSEDQIYAYATISMFIAVTALKATGNSISVLKIKKNIFGGIKSIIVSKELTSLLFFGMFTEGQITSPFVKAAIDRVNKKIPKDTFDGKYITVDEATLLDIFIIIIGATATSPDVGKCMEFSSA